MRQAESIARRQKLERDLRAKHLWRQRRIFDDAQKLGWAKQDGLRPGQLFSSNDYLGLSRDPKLIASYQQALEIHGVGSGSSSLICGYRSVHQQLEHALADFLQQPRALLFPSGYHANLAIFVALCARHDQVLADRMIHASLIDGIQLSRARMLRFAHNDMADMKKCLADSEDKVSMIVSEGVFSMRGDQAPIGDLLAASKAHDIPLLIDDAHGFGVLGASGRGSFEAQQLEPDQQTISVVTFGKAMGGSGAVVAANEWVIEKMIQHSRSYRYTTALPPAMAVAMHTALSMIKEETWRREKLQSLVNHFRRCADQLSLDVLPSTSPIQMISLGSSELALRCEEKLAAEGYWLSAIRPPTVPINEAGIRVSLNVHHDFDDIDRLLDLMDNNLSS